MGRSVSLSAPAFNTPLTLRLPFKGITGATVLSSGIPGFDFAIDNVSFTAMEAVVPEPGTMLLVGGGIAGMLLRRRERRVRASDARRCGSNWTWRGCVRVRWFRLADSLLSRPTHGNAGTRSRRHSYAGGGGCERATSAEIPLTVAMQCGAGPPLCLRSANLAQAGGGQIHHESQRSTSALATSRSAHNRTPILLRCLIRLPSVIATGRWRERGRISRRS